MWFPKFPYTNFSQINLDWVLRQIKELSEWMNRYFKDIRQDLDDEINNRIEGDKALGERIDKEIQDRTEADTAIGEIINKEVQDRTEADQQLQNNIDTLRGDAILKDGSTTTTAAIPFDQGIQTGSISELSLDTGVSIEAQLDMNYHKITTLADGSDNADAVSVGQMNTADANAVLEAVGEANSYTDSQLEAFAADVHSIPAGGNSGQVLAKVDGTNYNVTWVDQQGGGGTGNVPAGGTTGQVLAKATDADYQTEWVNQPEGLPAGGTEGQVVTKTADGAEWAAAPSGLPAGGTTGQVVTKTADGAEWADVPASGWTKVDAFSSRYYDLYKNETFRILVPKTAYSEDITIPYRASIIDKLGYSNNNAIAELGTFPTEDRPSYQYSNYALVIDLKDQAGTFSILYPFITFDNFKINLKAHAFMVNETTTGEITFTDSIQLPYIIYKTI